MRGEYQAGVNKCSTHSELPPRARRIPAGAKLGGLNGGTTSACAENTAVFGLAEGGLGNYLRVRGEYPLYTCPMPFTGELPPRARRIRAEIRRMYSWIGTTSACAENTGKEVVTMSNRRNYLRVRGEYMVRSLRLALSLELPPRARRILGEFI